MKTKKFWSIMMMLMLVLGTAITFLSCSKDDDNNGGDYSKANTITINGKSHKIKECNVYQSRKYSYAEFYFNDEMEGAVIVEFDGPIPSGDVKAADFVVECGYQNSVGAEYEGSAEDVSCTIKVADGMCTFKANNVKVRMVCFEDDSESFDATVSANYSGTYKKDSGD